MQLSYINNTQIVSRIQHENKKKTYSLNMAKYGNAMWMAPHILVQLYVKQVATFAVCCYYCCCYFHVSFVFRSSLLLDTYSNNCGKPFAFISAIFIV